MSHARFAPLLLDQVIVGDCLDVLPTLPPRCAALVFADPPFNIGYEYDQYDDRLTRADYLRFTDDWFAAVLRVLAPDGSLFVQIADEWAGYLQVRLDALGLTWRNTIIWSFEFGTHQQHKFGRDHQQILYYVRDPKRYTFNADAVRVPSARQTRYGDKRADPRGRVPGDVWHFPRVCGTFHSRNKGGVGCQTPEAVLDRIIRVASDPDDLVVDPFAGSGTTLAVAKALGRHFVGIELSAAYADGVRRRLGGRSPVSVA